MSSSRHNKTVSLLDPRSQLNLLVQSLESTFPIIERWNEASSPDAGVEQLIWNIQSTGRQFFDTLSRSVDIAEKSYRLSRDMITLCEGILAHDSRTEIKTYVANMKAYTRTTSDQTKSVAEDFNAIRSQLDEIANDVPLVYQRIKERETTAITKKSAAERRARQCQTVKACSNAAVAVVGAVGLVSVAFPPALLVVPIMLPIIILASEVFDRINGKEIEKRSIEVVECREAMADLHKISKELVKFSQEVDLLTDYWRNVDVMLDDLVERLEDFRERGGRYRLELKSWLAIWRDLKDEYRDYTKELKQMHAFYQHSLTCDSSSNHSTGTHKSQHNVLKRRNVKDRPEKGSR